MKNIKEEIINSLSNLGIEQSGTIYERATSTVLMNFENKLGLSLPEQYREFIISFDDIFFDYEVEFIPLEPSPFTTLEGRQSVVGLYGICDLSNNLEVYKNRMPNDLIPIGECPGGNLICLGVKESVFGKVYFWDHENEFNAMTMNGGTSTIDDISLYWDNLYLVAETFISFLHNLEIIQHDFEKENLNNVEIWLDDDLLNDD